MTVDAIERLAGQCGYRADRSSSAQLAYLLRDEVGKAVASLSEGRNEAMVVSWDSIDSDGEYRHFFREVASFYGDDADRLRKVFDRLKAGEK